jgi:ATP-dependent Clp protease ATP-binding subunit ClpA
VSTPELPISLGGNPLADYTRDLTEAALRGELEAVRCRDRETDRLIAILMRQSKNNPVLVGDAGVGKTAVVEGLAQRIVRGEVPAVIKEAHIYALSHLDLIAGSMYRGQYEKRLKGIVDRAASDPNAILFVDEMHNLIGAGTAIGQPMDAANMLKPALASGRLRVIGATTRGEFDRWVRPDAALERRFQPVEVAELTPEQTVEVLEARRPRLEAHHALAIPDDVLRDAVRIADDRFPARKRPDKAIDLLDEACSLRRVRAIADPPEQVRRLEAERGKLLDEEQTHIDAIFGSGGANILERFSYGTFRALENMGLVFERLFTGRTTPRPRIGPPAGEVELQDEAKRLAEVHARRLLVDDELREALFGAGLVLTVEDVAHAAAEVE